MILQSYFWAWILKRQKLLICKDTYIPVFKAVLYNSQGLKAT